LRAPRFSHPVGVGIFNRLGFCADHFRRLLCATRDNDRSTAFRAPVSAASPFIRGTQLRGTRKTDERYGHKSTSSLPEPSFDHAAVIFQRQDVHRPLRATPAETALRDSANLDFLRNTAPTRDKLDRSARRPERRERGR
jgi:hypothetical protein